MADRRRGSWWLLASAAFGLAIAVLAASNTWHRVEDGLSWWEALSGATWKEATSVVTGPFIAVVAVVWWWKGEF